VAEPSRADEFLTQSLKTVLSRVDVRVLDHLVVAGADVRSFAELGAALSPAQGGRAAALCAQACGLPPHLAEAFTAAEGDDLSRPS